MTNLSLHEPNSTTNSGIEVDIDLESSLHFAKDVVLGVLSFKFIQLILDYIKSKPPGQKSPVDTVTTILLLNLHVVNVMWTLHLVIIDCTSDSGETLAMVVSWPLFDSADSLMILLFFATAFHQLLIFYPNLIEKDFTFCFKVLGAFLFTYFIANDIFLLLNQTYPPAYYAMRGLPFRAESIAIRNIVFGVSASGSFLLRLNFCIRRNTQDRHQSDSKIVSDKSFLVVAIMISATVLYVWLTNGQNRDTVTRIMAIMLLLVWPVAILLCNEQIKEFSARRHPNVVGHLLEMEAGCKRLFQMLATQPFTRNVVHSVSV